MTTTHTAMSWFAGDDWEIVATLIDENGEPYSLGGQTILWALLDSNSQMVLDEDDANIIVLNAAAGICSIVVPAAKTSPLAGGQYSDVIRIVEGGITSTLSTGAVYVTADPWLTVVAALRRVG